MSSRVRVLLCGKPSSANAVNDSWRSQRLAGCKLTERYARPDKRQTSAR